MNDVIFAYNGRLLATRIGSRLKVIHEGAAPAAKSGVYDCFVLLAGERGSQGPPGRSGATGSLGATGRVGATGPVGFTGSSGTPSQSMTNNLLILCI